MNQNGSFYLEWFAKNYPQCTEHFDALTICSKIDYIFLNIKKLEFSK